MTRRLNDDEKARRRALRTSGRRADKRAAERRRALLTPSSRPELPLIEAMATAMEVAEKRRGRKLSYPALAMLAVAVMEEMAEEALRE